MIERLEHVALSVADLDRSLEFYCGLLGFSLIRKIEAAPPMRLGEIVRLPNCSARIAHLELGTGMLELFEYTQPRGLPQAYAANQANHGLIHFGLRSDAIHADYERLKAFGVKFWSEPIEFRPGAWVVYFNGPDQEVCELRQC